jgi:hypothetical protein
VESRPKPLPLGMGSLTERVLARLREVDSLRSLFEEDHPLIGMALLFRIEQGGLWPILEQAIRVTRSIEGGPEGLRDQMIRVPADDIQGYLSSLAMVTSTLRTFQAPEKLIQDLMKLEALLQQHGPIHPKFRF